MSAIFTVSYPVIKNVLKSNVSIVPAGERFLPNAKSWVALWDTGATGSVITPQVAQSLGLVEVSRSNVNTPQGSYVAGMYYIDIKLPSGLIVNKLLVTDGVPFGCDMLIGMDVISRGDFAVTNFNNKTVFSYRVPSSGLIDFVAEAKTPVVKRTSPDAPPKNSKCTCGSGMKYKQCCGKPQ